MSCHNWWVYNFESCRDADDGIWHWDIGLYVINIILSYLLSVTQHREVSSFITTLLLVGETTNWTHLTRWIFLLEDTPTRRNYGLPESLATVPVSNWLFDSQFRDYFRAANSIEITLISPYTGPQHKNVHKCYLACRLSHQLVNFRKKITTLTQYWAIKKHVLFSTLRDLSSVITNQIVNILPECKS